MGGYGDWCASQSCHVHTSQGVPMLQGSETEDGPLDDRDSQSSEDSTDENPPQNLDVDKDELLGPATDVSIPGGHSDDSVTLVIPPGEDNLL